MFLINKWCATVSVLTKWHKPSQPQLSIREKKKFMEMFVGFHGKTYQRFVIDSNEALKKNSYFFALYKKPKELHGVATAAKLSLIERE